MEPRFSLQDQDFVDVNVYMSERGNPVFKPMAVVAGIGILVLAGLLIRSLIQGDTRSAIQWIVGLVLVGYFLIVLVKGRITSRREMKRRLREETKDEVDKERVVRFTSEGLVEECAGKVQVMAWSSMSELVRAPKHAVICHGPGLYYVIPKRAFTEETEWEEFLDKATACLANAKTARPVKETS